MVIPLASAARSMSFLSSTDRRKSRRSLYSLLSITRTPFLTYFLRSSPLRDDRRLYHIILAMSSGNPLVLQHNWVVGGYEYTCVRAAGAVVGAVLCCSGALPRLMHTRVYTCCLLY